MSTDQQVIDRWSGSAPYWEKHRDTIRKMYRPVSQALIDDAQIGLGYTVLDVATGPGEPALTAAASVGTEGRIYGVDPIPQMVVAARQAADDLGVRNAQFEVAFADNLPFPADTFDAAVNRFGVMFFPAPVDAVRETVRVLKPGRKLAFAAWGFAESNPYHYVLSRVIDRYIDSPPPVPDGLEPFRFAAPGKLRDIVIEAGGEAVSERLLEFKIQAPISAEEFWTFRCEITLRDKIAKLSAEQLPEVRRQVLDALREYETGGGISFPAEVMIVSGTKPGR